MEKDNIDFKKKANYISNQGQRHQCHNKHLTGRLIIIHSQHLLKSIHSSINIKHIIDYSAKQISEDLKFRRVLCYAIVIRIQIHCEEHFLINILFLVSLTNHSST